MTKNRKLFLLCALSLNVAVSSLLVAQLITFGERADRRSHRLRFSEWNYAEKLADIKERLERFHGAAPERFSRGVYLTATSAANDAKLNDTFASLRDAGGSAIVIDVKGSNVYFMPMTSPLVEEFKLHRPMYDLPEIVKLAHEHGVYVIARFIVSKDPLLSGAHPDFRITSPKTGARIGETWVDPSHPTVLEYNKQILRDVLAAGVDEVNFDYIRFPTEWSPQQIGMTREEKTAKVEAFIRMARGLIDSEAPSVRLGISTYAIIGWGYDVNVSVLGQDVARFAPLVDVISPMAYPATFAEGAYYNPAKHPISRMYYLVYQTLKGYAEAIGPEQAHKLRPWIQGYGITVKNATDQIQAVYDAGGCGFQFWNAGNNYSPVYQAIAIKRELPAHCVGVHE
ncbi:MAG TPA: putative glycoside hydrolase [Candidatus Peribacteraceae bacterium]|nr:putative glycoside hydrolase [Candidatus Peribacteraceae bacterium]